jgi:hypothetical protein
VVVTKTVLGRASVLAWSGTQRDLMSLIEMVQRAFQDERDSAQRDRDAKRAELLSQNMSQEFVDSLYPPSIDAQTDAWQVQANYFVLRSGETGHGPLAEVLATIALQDLKRVYIRYPGLGSGSSRSVQLWFTRERSGTWCEIEGDDAVWVAGMAQTVKQYLDRRKPWWAWLHSSWGFAALYLLILGIFFAITLPLLPSLKSLDRLTVIAIAVGIALVLCCSAMALANPWSLNRLLPRFEILPDGQTPTGTKRLGWATTLFLSVVLGAAASVYITQFGA